MKSGGLRINKINKRSIENSPLITIITVVRNGEQIIEETIASVLQQEYNNIEYIIIDGGSTDNTIEKIKKHENSINLWISEPDKGIYDAMNKGIALASGEWINFMNAGDQFYDFSTLKKIVSEIIKRKSDIIYGDFVAVNANFGSQLLIKARSLDTIYRGNLYSHQSCFVKSEVLRDNLFDTRYKITADYNQMVSLFLQNKTFFYLPIPISIMLADGISYSNVKTYKEQMKIVHFYKPYSLYLFSYLPLIFTSYLRLILGKQLTLFIRGIKWKFLEFSNK
jgi:glycosyltransferase involved in cell wall biosynthesis